MRVGNLCVENAQKQAASVGFPVFLCGTYTAHSIKGTYREFVSGKWQDHRRIAAVSAAKTMGGQRLPEGLWYSARYDMLLIILWESYCQGQSSAAYFGRSVEGKRGAGGAGL
jgi:hypothetical protein